MNAGSSIAFVVSGTIGIAAHVMTLFALQNIKFNGCTYIYYKWMTIIEIVHMAVMVQYGVICLLGTEFVGKRYSLSVWSYHTYTGWHIGDMMKLAVSTVTTFISFERMVAVLFPFFLEKIKKNSLAYGGVLVGLFIGSAHLWSVLAIRVEYDEDCQFYKKQASTFSETYFYTFVVKFIYAAKIILGLCILIFSIAMIVRLRNEEKKFAQWNASARKDWLARRRLCMFSIIVGVCVLFDHIVWVAYKIFTGLTNNFNPLLGEAAVVRANGTFKGAVSDLNYARMIKSMNLAQELMGQLVHAYRFFIHVAFNKAMRDGVRKTLKGQTATNAVDDLRTGHRSRR